MKELKEILERIARLEERLRNTEKQVMTFTQAMIYLGFSKYHLYRLCYTKVIPHHKPTGGTIFFFKDEIDRWVGGKPVKSRKPLIN